MTGSARGGGDPCASKAQLGLGAAPRHVHVEGKITSAKRDMSNARAGCKDPVEVGEATRCLDDRDQIDRPVYQSLLAFQLRQEPIDRG